VTYLAGVLEEGSISSAEDINASIGELLVAYDAADDEDEALEVCEKIFAKLKVSYENENDTVKTESKTDAPASKGKETTGTDEMYPLGANCQARYAADGHWYPAEIVECMDVNTYMVYFVDYGNEEQVARKDIRNVMENETTKLLQAPVTIEDELKIEPSKKGKKNLEKVGYELDAKKVEKDRVKQQKVIAARARAHKKRIAEAARKKEEALQMWLNSFDQKGIKQKDVRIPNFSMSTIDGSRELVNHSEFQLVSGRKYGLIGRNGVGKSTLLNAISNYEIDGFPSYLRVVHVEQEIRGNDKSVIQWVIDSDLERTILFRKESELMEAASKHEGLSEEGQTILADLKAVQERMQAIDVHGAESRASKILAGLQFSTEMMKAVRLPRFVSFASFVCFFS